MSVRKITAKISGVGKALPEKRLTNAWNLRRWPKPATLDLLKRGHQRAPYRRTGEEGIAPRVAGRDGGLKCPA